MDNQDNQWLEHLEQGKDVPKVINSKKIIDVHQKLKAKYPSTPIPNPDRIIRTVSPKQQNAVIPQRGGK